jgi:hypothetical protein
MEHYKSWAGLNKQLMGMLCDAYTDRITYFLTRYHDLYSAMKPKWDADCTYNEMDFLSAALQFRSMAIEDALHSDNHIIRIFAILDRRVGTRTLRQIAADGTYKALPQWVRQFYELRLAEI